MENTEYNIWTILGIEATKDEGMITQAYREKLADTNPEDKPEEFKQLRSAYEEALAYAKKPEELQGENKEVDEWLKKLNDIYDDFARRKKVENWEGLFSEEICQSVAGHMRVEDELLRFLMEKYFIGHDVFLCMDRHFSFMERREELYEKYPRDFINNVIVNGILYDDTLPMTMFIPGEDTEECGRCLDAYRQIGLDENCRDKVEELERLKERHPYSDAWALVWKTRFEDPKYIEKLKELAEEYPEDLNIGIMLAGEYYNAEEYGKAIEVCDRLKEKHSDSIRLRRVIVDILEKQEKYDEETKELNEIIRMASSDVKIMAEADERRKKISSFVIEKKLKDIENDPDDIETKIDLCWAYLENDMKDEVLSLFETMKKEDTPAFDYYNILANITYLTKDYEKGIEALKELVKVIAELPEDTEKNIKRKKRTDEMYGRMAYYYQQLNDEESAMKAYEQALACTEDKAPTLTGMADMAYRRRDYEKVREYTEKLIAEKPDSLYGHILLAYANFNMHNDQEAYNAVSRALDLDGSDIGLYVLKIRILIRNNAFEEAENVIQFLESYDLKEDPSVLYARGLLAKTRDNDRTKAKEYFEKALEKIGDNGANYNMTGDLYLQLLYIVGAELDGKVRENREKMMELCDKGLSFEPQNSDLLEYRGWLLMMDGQNEESLKVFEELEKAEDHTAYVDYQVGRLYYKDLEHKAKESRDHFMKALEKGYDHGGDFYVGMCEMYMWHPDEAERAFLTLKEKEPDSVDPYERLISVYQMKNDLDKALEYADKLLDVSKHEDIGYYIEKVQILRMRKEYEAAAELLKEAAKKFKKPLNKRIFDVYTEAGMYKEAEKHLQKWLLMGNVDGEYYQCQIVLNMLKEDFKKARHIYDTHSKRLGDWERNLYGHLLALEEEDHAKDEKLLLDWKEELKEARPDQLASIYEYLAFNSFYQNDTEKQHMYAEMALEENEKDLQQYSMYRLLYMTRKYRILSLLGRSEETEELAQKIRKAPLCDNCQFCRCKDQEIFEMDAAELKGDPQRALELARKGHEEWPSEEDFTVAMSRLERKVNG